jgi:6-pyruvoyltetrahydropterin/6-carboxytetrahydropterin synthase
MFEVGVVAEFEAAHSLRGDFGPATRKHGHTYRVEATVHGARLRPDGTLLDISILQAALAVAIDGLHMRDLDDLEAFGNRNSTAEEVAAFLFALIAPEIASERLESLAVRVWESPRAFATYQASLPAG